MSISLIGDGAVTYGPSYVATSDDGGEANSQEETTSMVLTVNQKDAGQ